MNINFLGPVLPTDSFTQMAFVEILNIILTSDNIVDVNRMLRLAVGTFPLVLRKRPFHAVAAHGVQFTNLLRTAHIQHPFRYAGKPRQEKEQYDNELKTYIST